MGVISHVPLAGNINVDWWHMEVVDALQTCRHDLSSPVYEFRSFGWSTEIVVVQVRAVFVFERG